MNLAPKYRKSLDQQWCLRFETHLDGDAYDGIVTHVKRRFVVLREARDFVFDGVVILPKRVITGCRDGKYEKCHNAIIRENGEIKKARAPRWLAACDTIVDVLAKLRRRDIWPAVEMLSDEWPEGVFYLGPITSLDRETFDLHGYDAAGNWERVYELPYDEIGRIEFDSAYCNAFNAHMRLKAEK